MYDIAIIGGGINGCGIARDAAGRGLSVLLCGEGRPCQRHLVGLDQADPRRPALSRALRVPPGARGADASARCCSRMAPHIIWPLRFVLPHHRGLRPAWLIRLGLFLYDHLGGREHPAAVRAPSISRATPAGKPLQAELHARLRIFRLLGRRRAAGGAQRPGCRARAAPTSACAPRSCRRAERDGALARRAARRGQRAQRETVAARVARQRRRALGRATCSARPARGARRRRRPAGQGQPHRGAAGCSSTTAPTSSRTPTGASSSPSPTSTTSR